MLEIHPSMDSIRTLGILNGPKEQHDSALRVPDHEQEGPIDVHFKGRVYRGADPARIAITVEAAASVPRSFTSI